MTDTHSTMTTSGRARRLLNKVAEVTVFFWIIKVLATTVGETFADYLDGNLGFGLVNTALVMTLVFLFVLAVQFAMRRYVAPVYWLTVVLISVVGTLLTDLLTDQLGVPLLVSTPVFAVALAVCFGLWYRRERTLSIHSIVTRHREAWYWLAILLTFSLGTAAGDLVSEQFALGYVAALGLFAAVIAVIAVAHWGFKANPVLTFWLAYIMTRPLGASLGDLSSAARKDGGLGMGTTSTSYVFLGLILVLVVFLAVTRRDVTERRFDESATDDSVAVRA